MYITIPLYHCNASFDIMVEGLLPSDVVKDRFIEFFETTCADTSNLTYSEIATTLKHSADCLSVTYSSNTNRTHITFGKPFSKYMGVRTYYVSFDEDDNELKFRTTTPCPTIEVADVIDLVVQFVNSLDYKLMEFLPKVVVEEADSSDFRRALIDTIENATLTIG